MSCSFLFYKGRGSGTRGARGFCEWIQNLCLFDAYVCPVHSLSTKAEDLVHVEPVVPESGFKTYVCLMISRCVLSISFNTGRGLGTCGARGACEWIQNRCLFDEYVGPVHSLSTKAED